MVLTLCYVCVLVSQSFYNKVSKTGWLKTTETHYSMVLEPEIPKSRCQLDHALSLKVLREDPSLSLLASGVCQQFLTFLRMEMHHSSHIAIFSLCVCTWSSLCVSVSVSKFLLFIRILNQGPPCWTCFNFITSVKTLFPNKFIFIILNVNIQYFKKLTNFKNW